MFRRFYESGATIIAALFAGLVLTLPSCSSQGESPLNQRLAQAREEMVRAMVLSYAVNDTESKRFPGEVLATVNEALDEAQQIIEIGKREARAGGAQAYWNYFELLSDQITGVKSLNSGLFLTARRQLQQTLERVSPTRHPEIFGLLGNALAYAQFHTGSSEKGIQQLRQVIQVANQHGDPLYPMYLYNLGWLFMHSGDLERARAAFAQSTTNSRTARKGLWETLSTLNRGVVELIDAKPQAAEPYLAAALEGARRERSLWYQQMASYYLELAQAPGGEEGQLSLQPPGLTPGHVSRPTAARILSFLRSASMATEVLQLEEEVVSEGAQITVGRQSAFRGTLTVIPIRLAAAENLEVGRAELDITFPAQLLEVSEFDNALPERLEAQMESSEGKIRLAFRPKSDDALPLGLLGFLVVQSDPEAEPGDVELTTAGRARTPGIPGKEILPLKTIDGRLRIQPPQACYMYNHPPTRSP